MSRPAQTIAWSPPRRPPGLSFRSVKYFARNDVARLQVELESCGSPFPHEHSSNFSGSSAGVEELYGSDIPSISIAGGPSSGSSMREVVFLRISPRITSSHFHGEGYLERRRRITSATLSVRPRRRLAKSNARNAILSAYTRHFLRTPSSSRDLYSVDRV